ncbi:hypothetical protein AVEN_49368-1 [Araneus ventricosus]|uniref:Uncharacterized protein n=1 Tax=Araneus ventricosus TaxID=182803 RepID=A0A4Y2LT64_ARAVE|nr:hypothetical protein AVEN_49368-1 [Araneus ventricosus]
MIIKVYYFFAAFLEQACYLTTMGAIRREHITHDVMFDLRLVIDDQFLLDKGVLMYKQMDRSDLEFQTVANSFSINDFKNVTFQAPSTKPSPTEPKTSPRRGSEGYQGGDSPKSRQ